MAEKFDVIVIGSGPGGSLAACLVAEKGMKVLLIEEGPMVPQSAFEAFSLKEMDSKYRNQGVTLTLGSPKINYVEGRCLGGGSEVNSGLYFGPDKAVIDRWARDYKVKDFDFDALDALGKANERDINVSLMPVDAPLISRKLEIGAEILGWQSLEVPRWFKYDSNKGASGVRQSMTETFLPRFKRAGGQILSASRVNKIRRKGRDWTVRGEHGDRATFEYSCDNLFVSCGAIQTPALLSRSGIGRNVGSSLRMHPSIKVVAKFEERLNFPGVGVPVHLVKQFSPEISFGCSISSKEYIAAGLIDYHKALISVESEWPFMASFYAMTKGGNGRIVNLPGMRDPVVFYKLDNQSLITLSDGVKKLCKLLFRAGARELYPSISQLKPLLSDADIDSIPNRLDRARTNLMTIHLMGSCPMGEDLSRCAVDSYGKVHGEENLFVADASILCTALGYNPQGTTMAVVRRNVLKFLEKV